MLLDLAIVALDHIPENKRLTTKAASVGAQLFLFGFDDAVEIRHRQLVLRYHQVRRTVDLHLPVYVIDYFDHRLLARRVLPPSTEMPLGLVVGEQGEDPIDELLLLAVLGQGEVDEDVLELLDPEVGQLVLAGGGQVPHGGGGGGEGRALDPVEVGGEGGGGGGV